MGYKQDLITSGGKLGIKVGFQNIPAKQYIIAPTELFPTNPPILTLDLLDLSYLWKVIQ